MSGGTSSAGRLSAVGLALYAALLGLCLAGAALWPDALGWPWVGGRGPAADGAAGLAAGALSVAASWALVRASAAGRALADRLGALVEDLPAWAPLPLALAAGVAEEALFRGALWTALEALGGPAAALAATSLAFGAAHGGFRPGLRAWSAFALATGILLGALRWGTGGLLAPVVAHAVVDAVNLPLLRRRGGAERPPGEA